MGVKEKDWADRFYSVMITLPDDTTPERIKSNREKMLPLIVEAKEIKKSGYKDKSLDEAIELYHYFDKGQKSPYNIDGFQSKVKRSLAEVDSG